MATAGSKEQRDLLRIEREFEKAYREYVKAQKAEAETKTEQPTAEAEVDEDIAPMADSNSDLDTLQAEVDRLQKEYDAVLKQFQHANRTQNTDAVHRLSERLTDLNQQLSQAEADLEFAKRKAQSDAKFSFSIDKNWEKSYNLYTTTDDFIRQVPSTMRHDFARSIANKTSGMTEGETRTVYIYAGNIYAFRADGYMHGEMEGIVAPSKLKDKVAARKEYKNAIDTDTETSDFWFEPISANGRGSRGNISVLGGRGRSDSNDTLSEDSSERFTARYTERERQNFETKEEVDEVVKNLREMFGFDAKESNGTITENQANDIAPINEASSTDGVFFDGKYSLSREGEAPKRMKDLAPLTDEYLAPTREDISKTETTNPTVSKMEQVAETSAKSLREQYKDFMAQRLENALVKGNDESVDDVLKEQQEIDNLIANDPKRKKLVDEFSAKLEDALLGIGEKSFDDLQAEFDAKESKIVDKILAKRYPDLFSARKSETVKSITADMSDEQRYNALKDRSISLTAHTDEKNLTSVFEKMKIFEKDIEFSKYGDRVRLFKKLGEEFSAFRSYNNRDIKLDFSFSKENMRESVSKQRQNYMQLAKMLSCFNHVIDNAVGIEVHNRNAEGYKFDNTLRNVYVLASAFTDGDRVVPVKLEVKEFADKENTLHVAIALESINKDEIVKQEVAKDGVARQYSPSSTISIADYFRKIKPTDERFYKYIPKQFLEKSSDKTAKVLVEKSKTEKRKNRIWGKSKSGAILIRDRAVWILHILI